METHDSWPVTPAPRRWSLEDQSFKVILGYIVCLRPCWTTRDSVSRKNIIIIKQTLINGKTSGLFALFLGDIYTKGLLGIWKDGSASS